uniref:Uncharacterized protein n=1 Tax=Arundo donax TaxID=35708 RepID=A0A0A8YX39_ARUDO
MPRSRKCSQSDTRSLNYHHIISVS